MDACFCRNGFQTFVASMRGKVVCITRKKAWKVLSLTDACELAKQGHPTTESAARTIVRDTRRRLRLQPSELTQKLSLTMTSLPVTLRDPMRA